MKQTQSANLLKRTNKSKETQEGNIKFTVDKEGKPSRGVFKLVVLPPNRPVSKPPKKHKKNE